MRKLQRKPSHAGKDERKTKEHTDEGTRDHPYR